MAFIVFLRTVSDAGFYYFFASVVSGVFGARAWAVAAGLALDCAALTAGYLLRGRGARYLPLALPVSFVLFAAAGWAERVALAAHLVYAVKVLRSEDYEPTWDHEAALFSRFWKLALAVIALWFFFSSLTEWGAEMLENVLLPTALVTLTALILLTRALRHDREVYVQPRRLATDAAVFVLLLALAALLGSAPVLDGAWLLLKTVFRYLVYPILNALLWVVERVADVFFWLLEHILPDGEFELPNASGGQGGLQDQFMPESAQPGEGSALLRTLLILAGAAVLAYLTYRLLRMLLLRPPQTAEDGERAVERFSIVPEEGPQTKKTAHTPVEEVRREYRRFLRLCERRGVDIRRSDTTLSVGEKADARAVPESAGTLRTLYIAARYAGRADRETAEQAGRALREIKKSWKDEGETPGNSG